MSGLRMVFTCGMCQSNYNTKTKKPLCLPCGHVFCEECINKNKSYYGVYCPEHNIFHEIEPSQIPICAQILNNLPDLQEETKNNEEEKICCLRHQNNKIKFFCKKDRSFLCSKCVVNHNNHEYVKFTTTKKNFKEEFLALSSLIEKENENFVSKQAKAKEAETNICSHFQAQINQIESFYQDLNNAIQNKKRGFLQQMKKLSEEKKKTLEEFKKTIADTNETLKSAKKKLSLISKELLPKGDYEGFYNLKSDILSELKGISSYFDFSDVNPASLPTFTPGNIVTLQDKMCGYIKNDTPPSTDKKIIILKEGNPTTSSGNNYSKIIPQNAHNPEKASTLASFNPNDEKNIFKQNLLSENRKPQEISTPRNNTGKENLKNDKRLPEGINKGFGGSPGQVFNKGQANINNFGFVGQAKIQRVKSRRDSIKVNDKSVSKAPAGNPNFKDIKRKLTDNNQHISLKKAGRSNISPPGLEGRVKNKAFTPLRGADSFSKPKIKNYKNNCPSVAKNKCNNYGSCMVKTDSSFEIRKAKGID